jgi:hypothetical protein
MSNTKIMAANNTQVFSENLETVFKLINTSVYDNFVQKMVNFRKDNESAIYGACTFELNGAGIIHRIAKITPKKTGQFVAIWKRSQKGITMPFDVTDNFDFMVITIKCDHQLGQFIFPKEVLFNKGIISQDGKHGKRGIRVYPPWNKVTNKQAQVSQNWQLKYFLPIKNNETLDLVLAKQLYGI